MNDYISTLSLETQLEVLTKTIDSMNELLIITTAPDSYSEKLRILYTNQQFERVTGYTQQDVQGKSPKILQGKKTSQESIRKIKNAIKERRKLTIDILNYTKAGETYWISLTILPVFVEENSTYYYLGYSEDITVRKHALLELEEKQESLSFVLQAADIGYWDLDIVKNQTNRSLRHDQLFGYSKLLDHWSYETFLSHVHPEDKARVSETYESALAQDNDYDVEFRCIWPNGDIKWLWSKGRCIKDESGEVSRVAGIQVDISERKKIEEKIQTLAFIDSLTQLPNKAYFYDQLNLYLKESAEASRYGVLMFVDIDNFNTINDTLGHDIGDKLLTVISDAFHQHLPQNLLIARFGGDEFVILQKNIHQDFNEAKLKVEATHSDLQSIFQSSFTVEEHTLFVTISVGARLFKGQNVTPSDLLSHADLAMYQAKKEGKNRLKFFDSAMQEELSERTKLEKMLRRVLSANELSIVYQPKVNQEGELIGFEALLRWHLNNGVQITPDQFIPIAEETGNIVDIGQWVLNRVCEDIARWASREQGLAITVSVNVSAVQISHPDIVQHVLDAQRLIKNTRCNLMVEITEQTLITNFDKSVKVLNTLIAKDISFSLDDFGTGYSSLSYLKTLPISEIKIDKSFIRDILIDDNDSAIVSAVIGIAEKLKLNVVAEGVETSEQFNLLMKMGCEYFQGFYFEKPLVDLKAREFIEHHLHSRQLNVQK